MEIKKSILVKHLHDAAIEQIAFDYQKNGYETQKEAIIGGTKADLVVKKANELIVFEVKHANWSADRLDSIKKLRNYVVHERGASFRLALVNTPKETSIEVDNFEQILFDLVSNTPAMYDELATHIEIDDISDIDLSKVTIHKDETELIGTAVVNLMLQYGSDIDGGWRSDQSFLLDFHIALDRDFGARVEKLELDTSDFYDPQEETQQQVASAS